MINLFLYWLNTLILSLIWQWSQKMKLKNCDWNVLLLVIMSIVEELCRKGLSELLKPFVFAVTCKYMYIYLPFCFTTVLTKCQVCNEQHVSTCLCQTLKLCLFTISAISTEKKHICCHTLDGVVILQTSAVHIKIYSLINLIQTPFLNEKPPFSATFNSLKRTWDDIEALTWHNSISNNIRTLEPTGSLVSSAVNIATRY